MAIDAKVEDPTQRPELIIGLVCPLGTRIDDLVRTISQELAYFGYSSETIHLSKLLDAWKPGRLTTETDEASRISFRQDAAFRLRKLAGVDVLARAAIAAIRDRRRTLTGDANKPANATAFILRQLKHPGEVTLLRRAYGPSFILIAGHAPETARERNFLNVLAEKDGKAQATLEHKNIAPRLMHADDKENRPGDEAKFGQDTRNTYPLADCFVRVVDREPADIRRFVHLLFGHPFISPRPEELSMHLAYAHSLRSSDERRQVGAVIVKRTARGEAKLQDAAIVAAGMNEVPRRQGGPYWDGDTQDARDQRLLQSGLSPEDRIKRDTLGEIAARLKAAGWLSAEVRDLGDALPLRLLELLRDSQFSDISEFMRQVHAEMSALLDAARRGVAVQGLEMYVTTFPCHNCAKHIIGAGIAKVIYLQPYPKSRAEILHHEEIALDPENQGSIEDRVLFQPFAGVAPRQFDLFSMAARGRKNGRGLLDWEKARLALSPAIVPQNAAATYLVSEREQISQLHPEYEWDGSLA